MPPWGTPHCRQSGLRPLRRPRRRAVRGRALPKATPPEGFRRTRLRARTAKMERPTGQSSGTPARARPAATQLCEEPDRLGMDRCVQLQRPRPPSRERRWPGWRTHAAIQVHTPESGRPASRSCAHCCNTAWWASAVTRTLPLGRSRDTAESAAPTAGRTPRISPKVKRPTWLIRNQPGRTSSRSSRAVGPSSRLLSGDLSDAY
jgi:hypothetical protein